MMPDVGIVVAVYFPPSDEGVLRRAGFVEALQSWQKHLRYEAELRLIVVNDGPALAPFEEWTGPQVALGHDRAGLGASLNQGFREAFKCSPIGLNIVDDIVLTRSYELTAWVNMLLEDEMIGAVHLSAPYPDTSGWIVPRSHGWVVVLNRHNLAAGLRPALYHRRFFDAYGFFNEHLSAHETERLFNERFCQAKGPDSVLALPTPWAEGIGAAVEIGRRSPKED